MLKVEDRVKQIKLNHVFKIYHEKTLEYLNSQFGIFSNAPRYSTSMARGSATNLIFRIAKGQMCNTFFSIQEFITKSCQKQNKTKQNKTKKKKKKEEKKKKKTSCNLIRLSKFTYISFLNLKFLYAENNAVVSPENVITLYFFDVSMLQFYNLKGPQ